MYKSQTRGRKVYNALGGTIGIIAIIIVAIIVTVLVLWYLRKRAIELMNEKDDFMRYQKLMQPYLKIKRENQNFTEESVQFEMDRFQFTNVLLPLGDPKQNRTWDTDSEVFGDLCHTLMSMVSYGSDRSSKYYKDATLWNQILFSIRTISDKLPDIPTDFRVPWGTNWYQFSITYPTFLVSAAFSYFATFNREDPFMTRHLSSYITNYFKESKIVDGLYSIGWLRGESNVIGMSVPVIGGRLYSKRFNKDANSQKYAREYMAADYVYKNNGFYYDNTYITHLARSDGYTTSFYYEFVFVFDFYRMTTRFFKVLHKTFSIIEHPTIDRHHGPWFTRGPSMRGFAPGRKYAKLGVDIRGFERSICVRTKDVGLYYCGQIQPLAAYESDRTNIEWAQIWVFMRRPLTKTSASRLYKELVPYYDGVHSYGAKQLDWPSKTTTTTTYAPETSLCSLCCDQDRAAGMYNKYRLRMADRYTFDIEEINLATPDGFHVFFNCKVDMVAAASDPYTVAVRLGNLDDDYDVSLTGVGAKHSFAFDDFIGTFLYLDDIDDQNSEEVIHIKEVHDPETGQDTKALYLQPTARQVMSFGFSNNFYEYGSTKRHNNLNSIPNIKELSTENFLLEVVEKTAGSSADTPEALLFLHNLKKKTTIVSYAFNNELPRGITIKKTLLDKKFTKYTVTGGVLDNTTGIYSVNTYEKQFQIVLTNVEMK